MAHLVYTLVHRIYPVLEITQTASAWNSTFSHTVVPQYILDYCLLHISPDYSLGGNYCVFVVVSALSNGCLLQGQSRGITHVFPIYCMGYFCDIPECRVGKTKDTQSVTKKMLVFDITLFLHLLCKCQQTLLFI